MKGEGARPGYSVNESEESDERKAEVRTECELVANGKNFHDS